MDKNKAESLLKQIQSEKQGNTEYGGITGALSSLGGASGLTGKSNSDYTSLADDLRLKANTDMQRDAKSQILKTLLLAGGAGAAIRGVTGLQRMFAGSAKPVSSRTVDMPVMYPSSDDESEEKVASNDTATSRYGLNYFTPAMVLGAPLAAYGGWKGVDAIMDKQRQKKTDEDLEMAKQKYEQALLGSYKTASNDQPVDDVLGDVFDEYYSKQAESEGFVGDFMNRYAPNVPGMAKGLGLTYAIPAAVGGYAVVDSIMKKRSKRALLQKAMRERARRQAAMQPAELYAIPTPQESEKESQ